MRSWCVAVLCGLVGAGCTHVPYGWYPGVAIVETVRAAKAIDEVRVANAEEKARQAELERRQEARQRKEAAARERVLEQELAPQVQARPAPPPMPPRQQITVSRALARAQVGAAGSAQGFARAVLALVSQPDGSSPEELAALATEAAGYLQAALKTAVVRRTATAAWQGETRASFCLFGELPRTPAVDDALVDGCTPARAAMAADQVPGFMAECRERAGGRTDQFAWAGVAEDLKIAGSVGDRSHCR